MTAGRDRRLSVRYNDRPARPYDRPSSPRPARVQRPPRTFFRSVTATVRLVRTRDRRQCDRRVPTATVRLVPMTVREPRARMTSCPRQRRSRRSEAIAGLECASWRRTAGAGASIACDVVHERLQAEASGRERVRTVSFGATSGSATTSSATLADLGAADAVPDPGRDHPPILDGQGRARPRPHRLRQDHRLRRPARREPPARSQAGQRREFGRAPQGPDPRADPRARAADRPHDPADRPQRRPVHHPDLRRRAAGAARSVPCRRASTSSSAPPAASRTSSTRASSTSRRSAIAVLDEADHMCELGFLEPVQRILRRGPSRRQPEAPLLGDARPRGRRAGRRVPRRAGGPRGRR